MSAPIPLVTVIIPTFNGSRFIEIAIESAVMQTYVGLEVIIVIDGSTDETLQIVEEWRRRDARIKVIQKRNGGLSSARNAGLDQASGEFVAFLDDDDYWHPSKIAAHLSHFSNRPDVGVSYSGTQFVDEAGRPLRHTRRPRLTDLSHYYLYCRNPITNGSNGVFRRTVFEKHRFDESLPRNQDVDCWLRVAFAIPSWKFEGIPGLLTFYRVNPRALSSDYAAHYNCAKRVWQKSFQYAPAIAAKFAPIAEAFQFRFYARRALQSGAQSQAIALMIRALRLAPSILWREPVETGVTLMACLLPSKILKVALRPKPAA